jgi:hypothetical protein
MAEHQRQLESTTHRGTSIFFEAEAQRSTYATGKNRVTLEARLPPVRIHANFYLPLRAERNLDLS